MNAVDDAPVVVDSTIVIDEDQVIDIVLSATDVDDDDLFSWAGKTDPSNGTLQILNGNTGFSASKTYRYTPNTNYNGTDSFTYYATNQNAQMSNTGTVSFTINPVNDGPIANNLTMTVDEDWTGSTVMIKGDNNGATDPDGDTITKYEVVDVPSNGSIYNDAGGGIPDGDALEAGDELTSSNTIYNPNANYHGTDTFTFKASDGTLFGNTGTVSITVNAVNDDISFKNETNDEVANNANHLTDDSYSLKWNYSGGTGQSYNIYLKHYEGKPEWGVGTFSKLIATVDPAASSRYDGTFPSDLYFHTEYYFEISDANGGVDVSRTTTFNVRPKNAYATVVYPNGGEELLIGSTYTIKYNVSDDVNTGYNPGVELHLYKDETTHLGEIDGVRNYINSNGEYSWTIDNSYDPGTMYKIQLRSMSSMYDTSDNYFTIRNEINGNLTIFPDLISGNSERFSDIVYDVSTGGYIVAGYTHNKNDSGEGGTWKMLRLSVDSFNDTQAYEVLNYQSSSVMYNEKQNSVHGFDISRVSHDGSYLLSFENENLWSVNSSGSSVFNKFSGSIENGYNQFEYITNTFQLENGNYIVLGATRKGSTQQKYPVIAEVDQSLNIVNYKLLDNHVTDSSLNYDSYYNNMVYNHNDRVVYVIGQANIVGFNNSNQLNYYEVGLPDPTGSNTFTVNRYENLSEISGSPTQMFIQGENSDVLTYKRNPNGYDEFILATEESSGRLMLVYYRLMDNGSKEIVDTFYPNHSGNHDFMELVDSGNRYYLVAQEGADIRVQSVFDTENFSTQFDKLLDITGLGYEDKLGGATASNYYNNASGIAITGSTRKGSDDWDGFILLLDIDGE